MFHVRNLQFPSLKRNETVSVNWKMIWVKNKLSTEICYNREKVSEIFLRTELGIRLPAIASFIIVIWWLVSGGRGESYFSYVEGVNFEWKTAHLHRWVNSL